MQCIYKLLSMRRSTSLIFQIIAFEEFYLIKTSNILYEEKEIVAMISLDNKTSQKYKNYDYNIIIISNVWAITPRCTIKTTNKKYGK